MRVIIAGSRTINNIHLVSDAVQAAGFEFDTVVSGHARGVDQLGEDFAEIYELDLVIFPANWARYQNRAGIIRNEHMAEYADALIAIWDGKSKGTQHMITTMEALGKPVYVHKV